MSAAAKRTRRNIAIVGVFVALPLVALAAIRMMDREPTLMLPEQFDPTFKMPQRQSPDNAFPLLEAAMAQLPAPPEDLRESLDATARNMFSWGRTHIPRPNDHLGVAAQKVPGPMVDYLMQCQQVAQQVYDAAQKPWCMQPVPPNFPAQRETPCFAPLISPVLGYAALLCHDAATIQQGLHLLFGVIRISRWLCAEEGQLHYSRGMEEMALDTLCHVSQRPVAAPHLPWMQQRLAEIGAPYADRVDVLHTFWRKADNTITYRDTRRPGIVRGLEDMARIRETRGWCRQWRPLRPLLEEMAKGWPADIPAFLNAHPELKVGWEPINAIWMHELVLIETAKMNHLFHRAQLFVALQQYFLANQRYPSQLTELVPQFLDAVPVDDMNGQPLVYQLTDQSLRIYAIGQDKVDSTTGNDDLTMVDFTLPPQ